MKRIKTKWQLVDPYEGYIDAEFRSYKACAASIDAAYDAYMEDFVCRRTNDPYFECDHIVGTATVPEYNMDIKKKDMRGYVSIWYTTPDFRLIISVDTEPKSFYLRYDTEHLRARAQKHNAEGWPTQWKEYIEIECKYLFEVVEEIEATVEDSKELIDFIIKDMKKFLTKDMGLKFKH